MIFLKFGANAVKAKEWLVRNIPLEKVHLKIQEFLLNSNGNEEEKQLRKFLLNEPNKSEAQLQVEKIIQKIFKIDLNFKFKC